MTTNLQQTFLEQVADKLKQAYGNDLSKITVVFPNIRARLFLNEALCQKEGSPIWAPTYKSIDELFQEASDLQIADPLKLLTELYYCYISIFNKKNDQQAIEQFDEFYAFGEILLSDFQDIDKNLVNEAQLFSNLAELDKLKDDFEHLDKKQWAIIERFFNDITSNRSELKSAFFSIWSNLGAVYRSFKNTLQTAGIAYEGMLFRSVIENLQEKGINCFAQNTYVFVGFNVLTECEKQFFKFLKQHNKALFFWDYDDYYMTEMHEAGRFMRDNIKLFGNNFPDFSCSSLTDMSKKIRLVAAPSETAQAGYIPEWISSLNYPEGFSKPDSGIVLCNEQNLQAVMHAIPSEVENVNITMGFPLAQTPVYSLLTALTDLQLKGIDEKKNRFRYHFVLPVLRHPYIRLIFKQAHTIQQSLVKGNIFFPNQTELQNDFLFRPTANTKELASYLVEILQTVAKNLQETTNNTYNELYNESIFRTFQTVNRLKDLLSTGELIIEKPTFFSLLKRLLSSTSIPFHGEPAQGLQVMGLLETRNMDFKNVCLMSVNEGVLPKSENDSSFIPHFIRKFFGMTTIEHQDSLYAYYFYRLLQRAENIVLIYNTASEQTGKAEMSRFLLQLLTEYPQAIEQINLQATKSPHKNRLFSVQKTPELLRKLYQLYDLNTNPEANTISPSAFNNYLDCSLRFYLQYIEKVRPPKELSDDLDNSVLGSVFHYAVEQIYRKIGRLPADIDKPFAPFEVNTNDIDRFLVNKNNVEQIIEISFEKEYFNRPTPRSNYNGEQLIYFDIVKHFIYRLLRIDRTHSPFSIIGLEERKYRIITLEDKKVKVGGIVDRIDSTNGLLRVVDYKTGGKPETLKQMETLFDQDKKRANYVFQAFVYASILAEQQPVPVAPALLYINKAIDEDYSPIITWNMQEITNFKDLAEEFDTHFIQKLETLFNPKESFVQTEKRESCTWCDFKNMCGR